MKTFCTQFPHHFVQPRYTNLTDQHWQSIHPRTSKLAQCSFHSSLKGSMTIYPSIYPSIPTKPHSRRISQRIPIRHRHNLTHNLLPPAYNRRPADHKLAQRLVVTVLAVRRVPKHDFHRAERGAEIGEGGLVVQHVGLANGAGDLGVCECVDGPRAAVDLELEQFFRVQFDGRGAVRIDQTRCICQKTGGFWHGTGS